MKKQPIGGRDACYVNDKGSKELKMISFTPAPDKRIMISIGGESVILDRQDWKGITAWLKSWGYLI